MAKIKDRYILPCSTGNTLQWKISKILEANPNFRVTGVEFGRVPQPGSAIEGASNFGATEPGYFIYVESIN